MQYDPIKRSLGTIFNKHTFLRKIFYSLLDVLLLRAWHIKRVIKKWKKDVNHPVHVLDAGAGFGQYTYFMSTFKEKWSIKAVDVKQEQIDDCNHFFNKIKKADRVQFEYADLTKYTSPETYNLILSVDVMEHILEDTTVFKNFFLSMKKNGILIISTPSDQGGSDVHDHDDESFVEEHVRDGYNIDEIRKKLEDAGFSNIIAKYSYGNPGKISWKLSMKYPILMVNFSKIFFVVLPFYYIITFPISLVLNWFDVINNHKTGTGLIVTARKN